MKPFKIIKSIANTDATRGFKFISYAVWWIRQAIMQAIAEQSSIVRILKNLILIFYKVKRNAGLLETEFEREPLPSELAEHMGCSLCQIKAIYRLRKISSNPFEFV